MKSVTGYLIAALIFTGVGVVALTASRLERNLADVQEQTTTQQYALAQKSLEAANGRLRFARWVPRVGDDTVREVRARQAALQYWQGDYAKVLPAQAEPVAAVDESNVELQLVVANSEFRVKQTEFKDKASTVKALEESAAGYLTVLKNNTWHPDAAFNYEYIIRLRDQAAKGSQPPPPQKNEEESDNGESGAPTPATSQEGFQIYIPLEQGEKNPTGGEAGKASAKERKG